MSYHIPNRHKFFKYAYLVIKINSNILFIVIVPDKHC